MLSIYIGGLSKEIYATDPYFDMNYDPKWITDPKVKLMVKDIDKSEVISENIIQSPKLGAIPPQWLSGGVKTLICAYKDDRFDYIFNLSGCGDNCAKWVLEIGRLKDVTMTLHHMFDFSYFGDKEFEIKILNTGKIIHNEKEYIDEYFKCTKDW